MILRALVVQPVCYRPGLCEGDLLKIMLGDLVVQPVAYRQGLYEETC
jgi:hypothetical protein